MTTPVAWISGAGSGIGRELALQLARSGHRLALVGRTAASLRETRELVAREMPSRGEDEDLILTADVGSWEEAQHAVRRTIEAFGRLDVLVNNAGFAPVGTIGQTTEPMAKEVFEVNALGPMAAVVAAWPTFQKLRGGCVVNVSSMATIDPFPTLFAYAAAKASVNLIAKSVANEGREIGVRGFAVAPGAVETPMLRTIVGRDVLPESKTLRPEVVARVIRECIEGVHDARNGEVIVVPSPG
jgi:NAD(P)-dependent dehydrogenase (short-subunit alcohol dehydrogenase family)